MTVLNEYLVSVPTTNLWHLWAAFAVVFACMIWGVVQDSTPVYAISLFAVSVLFVVSLCFSFAQNEHIECVGYISDPLAFAEMMNDWNVQKQENSLITMRTKKPLTKDEVKEFENVRETFREP